MRIYKSQNTVDAITHPEYISLVTDWYKWRYAYEGGYDFIRRYLEKFSLREDDTDFAERKKVSYSPSFAKAGIDEVKNSIYQRMADITRVGGPVSYQRAIVGDDNGVDLTGHTMTGFIGVEILPELLVMGRVGIFVDMPRVFEEMSILDSTRIRPYLYRYVAEDIRSWVVDKKNPNRYKAVLLRDTVYEYDEYTGFPIGEKYEYRRMWKNEFGTVSVEMFNDNGESQEQFELGITEIPFVMISISHSLMKDIADYQIALLNLASSDIAYTLKSNFPFYVEQVDPRATSPYIRQDLPPQYDDDNDPLPVEEDQADDKEIKVGVAAGRTYPLGAEAPAFIYPSPEPMKASMEKQEQLKTEIRMLLNLAITNLRTTGRTSSAESKKLEDRSLESGLSNIGLTLEKAEREVASLWAMYEGNVEVATIRYPSDYSLKTNKERREEATELYELLVKLPSKRYQIEVAKQISEIMLSHHVSRETLEKIYAEIERAPNLIADPETLALDIENGLVSPRDASLIRGYPEGFAERAEKAHAERAARIALAQSSANQRGVADLDANEKAGKEEKEKSRQTDMDVEAKDKTRGDEK